MDDWEEVGQSLAGAGLCAGCEGLACVRNTFASYQTYQECPFRSAQAVVSQPVRE